MLIRVPVGRIEAFVVSESLMPMGNVDNISIFEEVGVDLTTDRIGEAK